jgi:Uma2 family endonuclease
MMTITVSLKESYAMATTVRTPVTIRADHRNIEPAPPITLRLHPVIDVTPDLLLELSSLNSDLRLELTAEGELVIMPPAGGRAGNRNKAITVQLGIWTEQDGTGIDFDSSTGFKLTPRMVRSPDASWVARARWDELSEEEQEHYPPLCPEFVVELRSLSDRVSTLQAKMRQYIEHGARLGWLIDPYSRRIYVYRPNHPMERIDNPQTVSADPVLPGFVLDLTKIW